MPDLKSFDCLFCKENFKTKTNMKRHIFKEHEDKVMVLKFIEFKREPRAEVKK